MLLRSDALRVSALMEEKRLRPEAALSELGFTDFESLLYCELLRQGAQTGYRLAQIVSKAPANTYQSLKTLANKGAVVVSDNADETKVYAPVPPQELLASLSQTYEARRLAALKSLQTLDLPVAEERVYQLRTVTQVIERGRAMFALAREIVLFDFFPPILEMMHDCVIAARQRGVVVAGMAYSKKDAGEYMPYNAASDDAIATLWPGLGMVVVADGAAVLIAQLSRDKETLLNGIWSDSAFLGATYHSYLAAEIRLVALLDDPADPLKGISLFNAKPPGLRGVLVDTGGG